MSKRKLLLADDSMTIQKVVNLTFADEGIEVFTVGNGSAAVEKLDEIEPDLVLADVHMPGLTGYEVCESIRQNPQYKDIPVMLLVGSFEPFDEAEMRRVGANDFLTKPFQSIRQLVQKVNSLLDEANSSAGHAANGTAAATETESEAAFDFNATLPQISFSHETQTLEESYLTTIDAPVETKLGDAGMDDEMIETSAINNFNQSSGDFASGMPSAVDDYSYQVETPAETEVSTEAEIRQTSPLSYDDIREIGNADFTPSLSTPSVNEQNFGFENHRAVTDFELEPLETGYAQNERAADVYEIDSFELETETPPANFDNATLRESEDLLQTEINTSSYQNVATTENPAGTNSLLEVGETSKINFDDLDEDSLLDIETDEPTYEAPYPDELRVAEQREPLPVMMQPAQPAMEVLPPTQDQIMVTPQMFDERANAALTQVGNQALAQMNLQFPPEVIEAIAQKVVEKLSDKVIEKIAWEIVPDRFDLIVRKHIQDRDR